jgi:hypothetical protein
MNEKLSLLPMGVTREDFELFKTNRPAWEAKVRGRATGELALRADASKPPAARTLAPPATQGRDATATAMIEKICRAMRTTPEEYALFLSDRPAWEKMVRERATQPAAPTGALMLRAATPGPTGTKDGGPVGVRRWEDSSTTASVTPIVPDGEVIALAASYRTMQAAAKVASAPTPPPGTGPTQAELERLLRRPPSSTRGRMGEIKMVAGPLGGDR